VLSCGTKEQSARGITVEQKYVVEFHSILDALEKEPGQNFDDYRVSAGSELRHRTTNKKMLTGEVSYSASSECPRAYLMMKIDAILGYLTIRAERKTLRRSHLPALEFKYWYIMPTAQWYCRPLSIGTGGPL
jgi:hypothetical protein